MSAPKQLTLALPAQPRPRFEHHSVPAPRLAPVHFALAYHQCPVAGSFFAGDDGVTTSSEEVTCETCRRLMGGDS